MFDIAPTEFLAVAVIALLVIGPKDLPKAMRVVGQWVGRARGVARQFRSGFDSMVREAELAEMEKKWAEENKRIMEEHGADANVEAARAASTHGVAAAKGSPQSGTLRGAPSEAGTASSDDVASSRAVDAADQDAATAFAGHEPDLFSQPVTIEKPVILPAPGEAAPAADTKASS